MISFLLRFVIPSHHRKGVALYKKGLFKEAIPFFKKSYVFFKRNQWIDKYRYITLLSSSRISYTEMALLNIAYCYGQFGDGKQSIEYYEKTLSEFPDSEMAKVSLRMYESAKNITEPLNSEDKSIYIHPYIIKEHCDNGYRSTYPESPEDTKWISGYTKDS